jgi:hypothetical protein
MMSKNNGLRNIVGGINMNGYIAVPTLVIIGLVLLLLIAILLIIMIVFKVNKLESVIEKYNEAVDLLNRGSAPRTPSVQQTSVYPPQGQVRRRQDINLN